MKRTDEVIPGFEDFLAQPPEWVDNPVTRFRTLLAIASNCQDTPSKHQPQLMMDALEKLANDVQHFPFDADDPYSLLFADDVSFVLEIAYPTAMATDPQRFKQIAAQIESAMPTPETKAILKRIENTLAGNDAQ
ncbi:hypothetical protein HRbin15_00390 [bacterium HR15]|nr:hypothetical protein HRbin15_00390 [bacterium HR15]